MDATSLKPNLGLNGNLAVKGNLKTSRHEVGVSVFELLVVVMLIVFFALTATRIVPAYTGDWALKTALQDMEAESEDLLDQPIGRVKASVIRRAQLNRVAVDKDDITIERVENGLDITVEYEVRSHLYFNVDALMSFEHNAALRRQ